ncbi:MAG TPA: hypothetical protein VGL28_07085 [Steroidobacteraceae bacterium]|jgi:hypothetical protein
MPDPARECLPDSLPVSTAGKFYRVVCAVSGLSQSAAQHLRRTSQQKRRAHQLAQQQVHFAHKGSVSRPIGAGPTAQQLLHLTLLGLDYQPVQCRAVDGPTRDIVGNRNVERLQLPA